MAVASRKERSRAKHADLSLFGGTPTSPFVSDLRIFIFSSKSPAKLLLALLARSYTPNWLMKATDDTCTPRPQ